MCNYSTKSEEEKVYQIKTFTKIHTFSFGLNDDKHTMELCMAKLWTDEKLFGTDNDSWKQVMTHFGPITLKNKQINYLITIIVSQNWTHIIW